MFKATSWDGMILLISVGVWVGGLFLRPHLIDPACQKDLSGCRVEQVHVWDRVAVRDRDPVANYWSFVTQDFAGYTAVLGTIVWHAGRWVVARSLPAGALVALGSDLVTLVQAAAWNGAWTEVSKIGFQRPRPLVYRDPVKEGADPAHYTSFYSGHTSFVAAVTLMFIFILVIRGLPLWAGIGLWVVGSVPLTAATGYFRVHAGVHFPSDVVVGAWMGYFSTFVLVAIKTRMSRGRRPSSA